jgi:hypothetical protein
MGWEVRGGGRLFYYQTIKLNGRPYKRYMGRGPAAAEQARRVAERRRQRQAGHQALLAEQAALAPADRALRDARTLVDLLLAAALLIENCHCHHGCWRRRRDATHGP